MKRAVLTALLFAAVLPANAASICTLTENRSWTRPPRGEVESSLHASSFHKVWVEKWSPIFDLVAIYWLQEAVLYRNGLPFLTDCAKSPPKYYSVAQTAWFSCEQNDRYTPCEFDGEFEPYTSACTGLSLKLTDNICKNEFGPVKNLGCICIVGDEAPSWQVGH